MPWKKEYEDARRMKSQSDPEYRARRNAQAVSDPASRKKYMQTYYAANPSKFKRTTEQQAKYNAARRKKYAESAEHRQALKAAVAAWNKGNPHKRKAQRLKVYGIGLSDFEGLMATQGSRCAICGFSDLATPKLFPVVDHCHKTGRVRGLLCMACNQGLGKFKDDVTLLMSAAAYLAKHG